VGYAVVPWKQRRGYAKAALRLILPEAKAVGLPYVEITTDPGHIASQRVIEANGGILVEHFIKPQQFGCKPGLRFRVKCTLWRFILHSTPTNMATGKKFLACSFSRPNGGSII
jgi:RimJ/RimL family protein N-acetyltransferase